MTTLKRLLFAAFLLPALCLAAPPEATRPSKEQRATQLAAPTAKVTTAMRRASYMRITKKAGPAPAASAPAASGSRRSEDLTLEEMQRYDY